MVSHPGADQLDLMVLSALTPAASETAALARRLERTVETVDAAVERLARAGFVEPYGEGVALTRSGRLAAAQVPAARSGVATGGSAPPRDLGELIRLVGSWWPADSDRAARRTARSALLASDADREIAVQLLSEGFSHGRLPAAEFEERAGRALAARTYGDLDAVLHGLGGLQHPVRNHPARKVVFWTLATVSSPFVLLGTLLFAFGADFGDHVGGAMFLVLLLPGLFALRRWAWPRT